MLSKSNPEIGEASATVYKLSQDEKIRMQCEDREEYFRRMRTQQRVKEMLIQENEQLTQQTKQLTRQTEQLTQQTEQLTQQTKQLTQQLSSKDIQIQHLRQKMLSLGLDPDENADM